MKTFTSHMPETQVQHVAHFITECVRKAGDEVNKQATEGKVKELYLIGGLLLIHADNGKVFCATVEEMDTTQ